MNNKEKIKKIKVDIKAPSVKKIKTAAEVIKSGGLVVYPTDTCYVLAADVTNPKAIKKVYKLKRRPKDKPISICVYGLKQMEKYGEITEKVRKIAKSFLPGPLSLIIKKKENLPDILSKNTICFRIPNNPVAVGLAYESKLPITSTSANLTGKGPYYSVEPIKKELGKGIDLILDGGKIKKKDPSTIIDLLEEKIVREGPILGRSILKNLESMKNEE